MELIHLTDLAEKVPVPGYHVRFVHTDNMTFAYWNIDADSALPEHEHPHEQVVNIIEGRFELTVDGKPLLIEPGDVVKIPGNVPHSGKSITDCRIIDVFYPVREDYK